MRVSSDGGCVVVVGDDGPHECNGEERRINGMSVMDFTSNNLSRSLRQQPIELFFQDNLMSELNPDTTKFLTRLHYSTRSPSSVHGADMLPSMAAGFIDFLEKQSSSLSTIKKIKFKKPTESDLVYSISPVEDKKKKIEANVLGEFVDNKDVHYYFYGLPTKFNHPPQVCYNTLPSFMLNGDPLEGGSLRHIKNQKKISLPLHDGGEHNIQPYVKKMEENQGYVRSVVLDMINLVCVARFKTPGLVRGYDNLSIDKDKFSPEQLFDGSCTLEAESPSQPVPLRDVGYGYEITFKLIHKEKGEVLHGTANLFSSSLCL